MRIVVLDGYALNPGDLSWEGLGAFGDYTIYDRTPPEQLLERAGQAQILLINKVPLSEESIAKLPALEYIGVLATGVNVVDLEGARRQGVAVTNIPGYGTPAVAQMTMALLLELTQQVGHHATLVRKGRWCDSPDFCFWERPLMELEGRTMGLVGFGAIAQAVGRMARAFGMDLLVHTRHPQRYAEAEVGEGVRFCALEELLEGSDVVSLHCPLTPETERLINAESLALMKPTALLLNTGRGQLVDEAALAAALNGGRLGGAGLDVLSSEPPSPDNPLLSARNCFITPHIAWATLDARQRLLEIALANIAAYLAGRPQNLVN